MRVKPDWIGFELGERYRLERRVGQGGMSAVYLATDLRLRRPVAVKMIHSHLADDAEFQRRFEDEATAVARLRHAGIVQVYDFNHHDDIWYMVMEFIEGWTLESYRAELAERNEKMTLAQTVSLIANVCRAVDYAHQEGIIHRDLKPANIMIRPSGTPVLMDFGIAKMVRASQKTITGMVIGTVSYMAPEQIKGEQIDHRVDIYALGVLLFELLTGRRPFEAESNIAAMQKHLTEPPPDLREFDANLPPELIAAVEKAMAKEPTERFSRAIDFAEVLEQIEIENPGAVLEPTRFFSAPDLDNHTAPHLESPASQATSKHDIPTKVLEPQPKRSPKRWAIILLFALLAILVSSFLLGPEALAAFLNPGSDQDGDGLTAFQEYQLGTDPELADSDEDGFPDKAELAVDCLNPLDPDVDDDGIIDGDDPFACEAAAQAPAAQQVTITAINLIAADEMLDVPEMEGSYDSSDYGGGDNSASMEGLHYQVVFETSGFTPQVRDFHVHFFYDTVPPEESGIPGGGPWQVHQVDQPFEGFVVADRPAEATQICVIVANPDHSIIPDTETCLDLPAP